MVDATERLVNLALLCSAMRAAPSPPTRIRDEVAGYGEEGAADEATFKRMLERDKKQLRSMGLVIESDAEGNYRLDRGATFASRDRARTRRGSGVARRRAGAPRRPVVPVRRGAPIRAREDRLGDPGGRAARRRPHRRTRTPNARRRWCQPSMARSAASKAARFDYTNSYGKGKHHAVEPYGLFARDGRWYLVARDTATRRDTRLHCRRVDRSPSKQPRDPRPPISSDPRTSTSRASSGCPSSTAARSSRPLAFAPGEAWRAPALTAGKGEHDTRAATAGCCGEWRREAATDSCAG